MQFEVPAEEGPLDASWIAPLDLVADEVRGDPRYQFFDRSDFMIMVKVVRKGRPNIIEYKHAHTRACLHLDESGQPYRYVPPTNLDKSDGRFVPHRGLRAALDDLGLWQLPWMKPGLEKYRYGWEWNNRWMLHPDVIESALSPERDDWDDDDEYDVCAEMYRREERERSGPREAERFTAPRGRLSLLPPVD